MEMYDLIITWHDFCDQNVKDVLRASGITLDAAVEILKMYQCTPSLHIKLIKIIELNPTPEQVEKFKNFVQTNSVYGVLSADTYDKLKQVEEEYKCKVTRQNRS